MALYASSQRTNWVIDGEKIKIEDVHDPPEMPNGKRLRFVGLSFDYFGLFSVLQEIPTTLTVLNISGCGLSSIPDSISRLTNLQRLRVEDNDLSEFPRSLGELTKLTRLRAYGNELSWLPEEFGYLRNLKILRLGDNKFKTHDDHDGLGAIKYMRSLQELYLKKNPGLHEIPGYVATKEGLRIFGVNQSLIDRARRRARRH